MECLGDLSWWITLCTWHVGLARSSFQPSCSPLCTNQWITTTICYTIFLNYVCSSYQAPISIFSQALGKNLPHPTGTNKISNDPKLLYNESLEPTLGEWNHAYGRSRYTTISNFTLRTLSAWSTSWRSSPRPAPSGPPTCSTWTWPPWSRWPDSCSPTSSSSCSSRWERGARATLSLLLWDWAIPQWSNCNYRNQIPIALFIIHILRS